MVDVKELVKTTMTQPMEAARQIMALGVKREVLWMGLVLVALLNAIQFSLTFQMGDVELPRNVPEEDLVMWNFFLTMAERPFIFTTLMASTLVISVFILSWVGQIIGGQGALRDVLAVVTWWQFVGFGIGLLIMVLSYVALPLASLLNLVTNIWLLFALSGLLAGAHGFRSPLGGLGTIILSILLLAIGLTISLVILGVGGSNV